MARNDDGSMVERVNENIRDIRESAAEAFDDEGATLPLLNEPEGERDESWWEENVQELKRTIEQYKQKLKEDDDSHRELRLELDAVTDLLPDRNEN